MRGRKYALALKNTTLTKNGENNDLSSTSPYNAT